MFATLLALFPAQVLAMKIPGSTTNPGKNLTFYGSVGVEAEDYQYDTDQNTRARTRMRTRFDLNGRGFIWDPRFATYDAGVTLQRDNVKTTENEVSGDASYNLLGYRLNTTWFANKPYPLSVFANRSQNTVADFWSPSYEITTNSMGARWGLENRWLGNSRFYLDRISSESSNSVVPRSERSLSYGLDVNQKLLPKQWGESSLAYGYRHTAWDEMVYGSQQRQDYLYLNDRSLFGEKANLTANVTYYDRSDNWTGQALASSFFGLNSMLTIQQTEKFRHYYGLGIGFNKFEESQNASQTVSTGVNYRLNEQWQVNAMLGLSANRNESTVDGSSQATDGNTTSGSAGVMYSDKIGNYLLSGNYTMTMMRSNYTTVNGLPGPQNTVHAASLGYARMNSPRFSDSLQLRMSRTVGEPNGSESNIRYSVNSALSQSDMLQALAEYRSYQQNYRVWSYDLNAYDPNSYDYYYYSLNSKSSRMDLGWLHRFSETSSLMFSLGATNGTSQDIAIDTRYTQARATMRLRSALLWTALVRSEQINGPDYVAGKKLTIESDLNYQIGKWQAGVRYRLRDAQQEIAPFKEKSLVLMLKRDYGFRL